MTAHQANGDLLSSWKEISDYLGCNQRTCRRWELNLGLPVHRIEGTAKSRVYAYKLEIEAWRKEKLNGAPGEKNGLVFKAKKGIRSEHGTDVCRVKHARRGLLWLISAAALVVVIALKLAHPAPGEPADFRIKGSKFILLNEKGDELWPFDTKLENLFSEQEYRTHFQTRGRTPQGALLFPYIVLKDINRCGRTEVLFAPKRESEYYEPGLYCLDSAGNEMWHYKPGSEHRFGEHTYSADYRVFGIEPCDINGDGRLEVIVITAHQPHSPSEFVVLNSAGMVLGKYVNFGRISDFVCTDTDADGNQEVLIAGMNDEYGKGFVALFNSNEISGASPQGEKYSCRDCGSGSAKYYLLFPRTDVDETLKPDKETIDEIHLLKNNRFELVTRTSHIYFELDSSLGVQDVKGSDIFRNAHRELHSSGKIKTELNEGYYLRLKKSVLYWNGREWTATPSASILPGGSD